MNEVKHIDLDQRQLNIVRKTLANAQRKVTPDMVGGVDDACALLGAEARNNMGVDSGALVSSEWDGVTNIIKGKEVVGKVTMQKPGGRQLIYAWIEEEGGEIVPRPENKLQRLVWQEKGSGKLIFARRVYHKGKHYMKNALAEKGQEATSKVVAGMTGLFNLYE